MRYQKFKIKGFTNLPVRGRTNEAEIEKKSAKSALAIAGLLLLTVALCSLPDIHLEKTFGMEYSWWFDMLQHGGYYFVLTIILFLLLPYKKYSGLLLFLLICGSVIFEIIQIWIPERSFNYLDIFANYIGITGALFFYPLIPGKKEKRKYYYKGKFIR
jgi:VanZ family protein